MSDRERRKLSSKLQGLYGKFYKYEDKGISISSTFHTLPLRSGTDYYKIVRNPLSLHAVGRKIKNMKYENAQQFVDDLALISWNARLYNLKDSKVYKHALFLKQFILSTVIPKLKSDRSLPNNKSIAYPHLGDLPDGKDEAIVEEMNFTEAPDREFSAEPSITPQVEQYVPIQHLQHQQLQLQQQPPSTPQVYIPPAAPRHAASPTPKNIESGIRRGRPPIIDKPFETRIKLILKSFKKLRDPNNDNRFLTQHFEKLPDSKINSDYYQRIPNPISLNEIRVKVRTRKYSNVDQFIHDLDIMFSNAQLYYESDPYCEEFIDLQNFNKEAQVIIQQEISKSDQDLIISSTSGNDGIVRFPLDSVEVNGYTYKIGDWVLISNPADPEKPTVGQVFRMWSTKDGTRYFNACWYYRPEQTCHGVDRLFFINEVCKTGQYRDHIVSEIVGPCYVIFLTRYQKGDLPAGVIPEGAPWFICEFRYNETTHVFNRIRTWKACLPDEVRDNPEQPIIPLKENRKLIKYESPIRSLLPKDSYLGMAIPDATPGQPNSPPLVGSVYITAPIKDDDLGQYTTSPNTVPVPDHNDINSGRRAFLFTPISQLKGGGGITHTVYTTSTSEPPVSHFEEKPAIIAQQLPGSYKSLQAQIQESQAKQLQEQQLQQLQQQQHQQLFGRVSTPNTLPLGAPPAGVTYHTSTSTYSTLLAGGVLSYIVNDSNLTNVIDGVNKRKKIDKDGNSSEGIVFYRAPPVALGGNRIITNNGLEFGHSAKYLAWKLSQQQQTTNN
ncbi:uncharacterized protein RJT21DRAFT_134536 [Scheffersomyces amazonensis]|uniref:uncharacterized protein n=1 Tax=Scheffersomyces amazonensis TaxID=1078765 RepID=UPI00315D4720